MVIQSFCPLRVAWTKARSTVLGRTATTGLVLSAPAIRATPTTCTSIRATWSGTTAVAVVALQCVQSVSEQGIRYREQGKSNKSAKWLVALPIYLLYKVYEILFMRDLCDPFGVGMRGCVYPQVARQEARPRCGYY